MSTEDVATAGRRRCVLIFDDDNEVLALAKAMFERARCTVDIADNKRAFTKALSAKPELVVLDLSLNDLDGIEAFSLIANHHPEANVLLFSGHSEAVLSHARRLGEQCGLKIVGTLRKPFTRRDVFEALSLPSPPSPPVRRQMNVRPGGRLLEMALENGWLEFWYQPKVHLNTGAVIGAECLARIRHPAAGLVSPSAFLPDASDSALLELTRSALGDATRLGAALIEKRERFHVSVNIAGRLLRRHTFLQELLDIYAQVAAHPRLILELTETDLVEDPTSIQRFATRAVLNGFGISIDDFGHGYANFDRLRQAPFCELKIDRSLTHGCSTDAHLRTLCRAAVDLAHGFKAEAVAEGVDNWCDLALLRELSFDMAQGYLFSPPVQRDQFAGIPFRYDTAPDIGRQTGRQHANQIEPLRAKRK